MVKIAASTFFLKKTSIVSMSYKYAQRLKGKGNLEIIRIKELENRLGTREDFWSDSIKKNQIKIP